MLQPVCGLGEKMVHSVGERGMAHRGELVLVTGLQTTLPGEEK